MSRHQLSRRVRRASAALAALTMALPLASAEAGTPTPPRRPAAMADGKIQLAAGKEDGAPLPLTGAAKGESAASLTDAAVIQRADSYLNGIGTIVADFAQINPDGRRLTGTFYLQRPGKLRFVYNAPSTLEVVSDGELVVVRDRKLVTQDQYNISQTPLKFLLANPIDLRKQATFKGVTRDADTVRINLEDRSTIGGTSKITLIFDPEVKTLKSWRIVDPQGLLTTVLLSNIDRNQKVDPRTFNPGFMRPVDN